MKVIIPNQLDSEIILVIGSRGSGAGDTGKNILFEFDYRNPYI